LTLKRQPPPQPQPQPQPLPRPRTAALVAALEHAWDAIAARHPQLPPAAIIVGQGSGRRGGGLVLGHFAAERWQHTTHGDGARVHEVLIGGEGLQRGPADVLATLLHEAAHALASVRALHDTSRQGRYHNATYKTIAEELGLTVARHPDIGWSLTALPASTADAYADTIDELTHAITLHRRSEATHSTAAAANLAPAACSCPRRIRVAPGTLAHGPIICAICHAPFTLIPATQPRAASTSAHKTRQRHAPMAPPSITPPPWRPNT
jgi:hypothetical protein